MIARWLIGLSLGTLIIAATSPWFVRSYVPRTFDVVRQRVVLAPGQSYRWRAEGYATTSVGPHGMMGRTRLPIGNDSRFPILALWGDSQAEGVSLADTNKLWNQLETSLHGPSIDGEENHSLVHVLPMASSGDDAGIWRQQMPLIETELGVDGHIILLCEMVDLMGTVETSHEKHPINPENLAGMNVVTNWVPDFLVHAGRNLFTEPQTMQRRRLRFGLGPVRTTPVATQVANGDGLDNESAERLILDNLNAMREATSKPIYMVYAPRCPLIMDGELRVNDPKDHLWNVVQRHAEQLSLKVIDCRDAFRTSVASGVFPHGFHNGRFGNGHLNAVGYALIANEFARRWREGERQEISADVLGATE